MHQEQNTGVSQQSFSSNQLLNEPCYECKTVGGLRKGLPDIEKGFAAGGERIFTYPPPFLPMAGLDIM